MNNDGQPNGGCPNCGYCPACGRRWEQSRYDWWPDPIWFGYPPGTHYTLSSGPCGTYGVTPEPVAVVH